MSAIVRNFGPVYRRHLRVVQGSFCGMGNKFWDGSAAGPPHCVEADPAPFAAGNFPAVAQRSAGVSRGRLTPPPPSPNPKSIRRCRRHPQIPNSPSHPLLRPSGVVCGRTWTSRQRPCRRNLGSADSRDGGVEGRCIRSSEISCRPGGPSLRSALRCASVAQLDRAADYGSAGSRFNSWRMHHFPPFGLRGPLDS